MRNISRRECFWRLGASAAAIAGSSLNVSVDRAFAAPRKVSDRPNIIFIFADDMGWADLPVYGYLNEVAHGGWNYRGDLKTPNFNRMAREGTIISQFYVASAVCSPSRAGVMTGLCPGRLGIHDYIAGHELNVERGMPDYMDPSVLTVTRFLQQNGYATGHFGKWHLSGNTNPGPLDYGLDIYDNCIESPNGRPKSSETITTKALKFIKDHSDAPFYINMWLYDPHAPLHPTKDMLEPYMEREYSPGWGDHIGNLQVWYSVITFMDTQLGRIMDSLNELGLTENTMVVFSADNGVESPLLPETSHYGAANSNSSGPFRGIKRSLYEGGIREPFIIWWPGMVKAAYVDTESIVGGVDWLPTVCSLAGLRLPRDMKLDGEDMSQAVLGNPKNRSKPLLWENRLPVYGTSYHKSPMLAIRDGRWKLLMNPDMSRIELYDIPKDPTELQNLAGQYPDMIKILSSKVLAFQKELPPGPVHELAGKLWYPWPKEE